MKWTRTQIQDHGEPVDDARLKRQFEGKEEDVVSEIKEARIDRSGVKRKGEHDAQEEDPPPANRRHRHTGAAVHPAMWT